MKALITGGKGFVGKHLTELLEDDGIEVMSYDVVDGQDITDEKLHKFVAKYRPDYIYHLAAVTSVPESFADPLRTAAINVGGSINLLEAVRKAELPCRILLASSTEVYSPASDDTPLDTASPVQPRTPYGVSKLAMEQIGAIYANVYKMHIVVTRTTNHTGPGQDGNFAVTSFARQIADIEKGKQDILRHGDLGSFKAYLDVRDVVSAYKLAINLQPFIYNIAANDIVSMQDILDMLIRNSTKEIQTSAEKSLMRPYTPDRTQYQTSQGLREAGWKPVYTLEKTLKDTLEYWRNKNE